MISLLQVVGYVGAWDWYWIPQQGFPQPSPGVFQNPAHTPLRSIDVLTVNYQTSFAPIYWVEDAAQIAARAAIEGNSGIYEDVQDAPNAITDPVAIMLYAQALLDRYGANGMPYQVSYSTTDENATILQHKTITPGQLQNIVLANPALDLLGGLISDVQITEVDATYLQYSVTVLSGEYQGNWTQFFAALVTQAQLPSPSPQRQYTWPIAPTIPGLVNPGVTGGYATPQVNIVNNAVELIISFQVYMPNANTGTVQFTLLVNGSGLASLAITFLPGETGTKIAYVTIQIPLRTYAGDVLAVDVTGAGISAVRDAYATLMTSIIAT